MLSEQAQMSEKICIYLMTSNMGPSIPHSFATPEDVLPGTRSYAFSKTTKKAQTLLHNAKTPSRKITWWIYTTHPLCFSYLEIFCWWSQAVRRIYLKDNWRQAEAWIMLFVGAVAVTALAHGALRRVSSVTTLPIGRWTRYHCTNMATHIFFQGVGTFSGRLRRYVSEVNVFLLCFFVHGTTTHSFPVRLLPSKLLSRGLVNIVVIWCILLLSAVNTAVVRCILLLSGVHYCCLFYHTSQTKHSSVFSVIRWRVWQN